MGKKFDTIINILIIILIIALITVMMSYYMGAMDIPISGESVINTNNYSGDTNEIEKDELTNDTNKPSGESQSKEENINKNPTEIIKNEETQIGDKVEQNVNNVTENITTTSPVIIKSENDISSKEKKEILTEIDKTLMELLEVVDKVQTVDESRLITEDSEVQE